VSIGVLLGLLLLAACVTTDDDQEPGPGARDDGEAAAIVSDGATQSPSGSRGPAPAEAEADSAYAGVEERGVIGHPAPPLARETLAGVVAYDAAGPAHGARLRVARLSAKPQLWPPSAPDWNTEEYDALHETGFLRPTDTPLSTFSVDVDTASYANVRRFLREDTRPPVGAVRIEELVNYFRYPRRVEPESEDAPFAVDLEIFDAPWRPEHRLVRIAVEGRTLTRAAVPPRNLVFLLDVSGSMQGPDRLGLVRYGLERLTESLRPIDRVSIVVYAGASGLVLPPTPGDDEEAIVAALGRLEAGGSTAGAAGLRLAYQTAREHFDRDGINRVILATDGDFNVGVTSQSELVELIEGERESGVFLTVLGVGRGNLNDATMEQLADRGNGQYAYLDSRAEARRVLVEQADATLVPIAKDVKIQVEFNPAKVASYRLIGYENRRLADQDFADDRKDAGEIGAGHQVTALYEIVPVDARGGVAGGVVDPLRYQQTPAWTEHADSGEWLSVKLRYKAPDGDESRLVTTTLAGQPGRFESASENARFSSAVALFGMLLRDSEFKGAGHYELVAKLARSAIGEDAHGERREFLELVERAARL
jgi:Ca-activated chloride channel family protein